MKPLDLSIIILNFNTCDLLSDCLLSIQKSQLGNRTIEVIVVDNASSDNSIEKVNNLIKTYPWGLKLIINKSNIGFAAGNNCGIKEAKGRYILLLNSDTQVKPDTLINQIDFMDTHSEFAVSTCRVELANGVIDPGCHRGFPTLWASLTYFAGLEKIMPKSTLFSVYHQGWKDLNGIHAVDVISGAFFFARSEVFKTVGLLDEDYFMYAEDIDMCLRISEQGMKIGFNPGASIVHFKGLSGRKKQNQVSRKQTNTYFWSTMKQFYQKHYQNRYPKFVQWLVYKIVDWKIASYE